MQFELFVRAGLVIGLLLISAAGGMAQVTQVSGRVTLKQADGSIIPVAGAQVDIYRIESPWEDHVKTNKKGEFLHAGVPVTGLYTIAVSAPAAKPASISGILVSQEPEHNFELQPGDGSRLTREQIVGGNSSKERMARAESDLRSSEYEKARKVIARDPDNLDANCRLGLALFGSRDKKNYQEAADHLQRCVDLAPDTDSRKKSAKTALNRLMNAENIQPRGR